MAPSDKYLSSSIFKRRSFSIFRSFSTSFASPVERRPAKVLSSIRGRLCLGSNQDEEKTWKRKVGTSPTLSLPLSLFLLSLSHTHSHICPHTLFHLPSHALSLSLPLPRSLSLFLHHSKLSSLCVLFTVVVFLTWSSSSPFLLHYLLFSFSIQCLQHFFTRLFFHFLFPLLQTLFSALTTFPSKAFRSRRCVPLSLPLSLLFLHFILISSLVRLSMSG